MENEEESIDASHASAPKPSTTISELLDIIGFGFFQVKLYFVVGLTYLADAMEVMIISVLGPVLQCSTWEVTKSQLAFLTTMVFLAMGITAPIWGIISDAYGRRRSIMISSALLLVFGFFTTFSPTFTWLVALRFLCGCCISCLPQCITILNEYLPSGHRGKSNIWLAFIWSFGGILITLLAWGFIPAWEYGWRLLIALCTLPVILFLSLSFLLPESLLFLAQKGRTEEVCQILDSIAKTNNKLKVLDNCQIDFQYTNKHDEDETKNKKFLKIFQGMRQLLEHGRRTTTLIVWLIGILCAFNYYGLALFATELTLNEIRRGVNSTITISGCKSLTSSDYIRLLWTSSAEIPASVITLYIMDIIGRKKTFAINSGIFTLTLIAIVIGRESIGYNLTTVLLFLARGSAMSYVWVYLVYVPEAYPTEIRSVAFGVASACMRIGGMITPYIAQVLMERSEFLALGVYILMGILGVIAPMLLPIETKGMDLSSPESYRLLD